MSVLRLDGSSAERRDELQRMANMFRGLARDIRRRVFGINKMNPNWRNFDPGRRDMDALQAMDRIIQDYPGALLSLIGPQGMLWAAAIRRDAAAPEADFVTAELRPLAISLAVLRFLDKHGSDAIRRIDHESSDDRSGEIGRAGVGGDGAEGS